MCNVGRGCGRVKCGLDGRRVNATIKTMIRILALSALLSTPAIAACPPAPDITDEADALLTEVQRAKTEGAARDHVAGLWQLWTRAPDADAQALLDTGMRLIREADLVGAVTSFDALIGYCPDYAEGYNQRAFANFLRQDYRTALEDLDAALERSPNHVAAMSGKALTLMGLGRMTDAQIVLREALALNPWLPERRLLEEPEGEEL